MPRSSRLVPRTLHLFFPVRIDQIFEYSQGCLRTLGGGDHDLKALGYIACAKGMAQVTRVAGVSRESL